MITVAIDAKELRYVIVVDVPYTFIRTNNPPQRKGIKSNYKITGALVDMLLKLYH